MVMVGGGPTSHAGASQDTGVVVVGLSLRYHREPNRQQLD